jgi:hypothetical protein
VGKYHDNSRLYFYHTGCLDCGSCPTGKYVQTACTRTAAAVCAACLARECSWKHANTNAADADVHANADADTTAKLQQEVSVSVSKAGVMAGVAPHVVAVAAALRHGDETPKGGVGKGKGPGKGTGTTGKGKGASRGGT